MKISIAGHGSQAQFSVKDFLEKHPKQWSAVIINASGEKLPSYVEELAIEHFNVQFDDVVYSLGHTQPPEKSHVEQILTWCKGKEDIVFACAAGISRSSASAYIAACQECEVEEAIGVLDPNKHQPNKRIVYLGAKILDDPSIWDTFVKWSKKHQGDDCEGFRKWFEKNGVK
jgi:predicted protein tyrosine phosphatase